MKKRSRKEQGERSSSSSERERVVQSYLSLLLSFPLTLSLILLPRLGIINTGPVECRSPHSLGSPRVYPSLPSSSPLIPPPPVPPYPASFTTSDQFPCPRLGPNGGLSQPLAGQGNRKPSQRPSSRCSGAADGKEIKKWSTRNEDGDNTHGGGVLLLTAAAQILDPHYPRAPQKQSSISAKEKRVACI